MSNIFVALGSSIGDAEAIFFSAEQCLAKKDIQVLKKSKILQNEPYGGVAQNIFSNAVWQISFEYSLFEKINWVLLPNKRKKYLKSKKLLKILQSCEDFHERKRGKNVKRWDDRTLDLDILMFDDLVLNTKKLTIPHREIDKRVFVLQPWSEIVDENFKIPKFGVLKDCLAKL